MLQKSPMYAYLPAKDVARARQFYEQKPGFKPKQETAGGVVYEFGEGTACFLYPTDNAGTSKASQAFWQVEDVEREVAELKARGVNSCGDHHGQPRDPLGTDVEGSGSLFTAPGGAHDGAVEAGQEVTKARAVPDERYQLSRSRPGTTSKC